MSFSGQNDEDSLRYILGQMGVPDAERHFVGRLALPHNLLRRRRYHEKTAPTRISRTAAISPGLELGLEFDDVLEDDYEIIWVCLADGVNEVDDFPTVHVGIRVVDNKCTCSKQPKAE